MKKLCLHSDERIDRISDLPDSILNHIVSFLPTEDAFRTIFLSKLWRQVFSSLSTLDFNQSKFKTSDDFKKFVDYAVILHCGSTVQNFMLCIDVNEHISSVHVNTWISFAIEHNIRDFRLRVRSGHLEKLPCCLFTSSTLTTLTLESIDLKLPMTISFPKLKIATLDKIKFFDDYSTNYLFSSCCCPVLEKLIVAMCDFEEIKFLTISSPTIRALALSGFDIAQKIKISTLKLQNLSYFHFDNGFPNISPEQVLSSLVKVCFGAYLPGMNYDIWPTVCRILARLSNVVNLSLGAYYVECLTMNKRLLQSLPPSLCSLKSLDIDIRHTKNQVQVIYLLQKSCFNLVENLRICIIQVGNHESLNMLDMEEYWKSEELPTECVLKRLRSATVASYTGGSEDQIKLVKFVLENAIILEKMTFLDINLDRKVREKVMSLTRASPHVRFIWK